MNIIKLTICWMCIICVVVAQGDQRFRQFDKNGDGFVTRDEAAAILGTRGGSAAKPRPARGTGSPQTSEPPAEKEASGIAIRLRARILALSSS
jgi:hypothetical protein